MKIFKYQKKFFYYVSIIFIFLNVINYSFAESIQPILHTNLNNRFIEVKEDWVCNDSNKDTCSIEIDPDSRYLSYILESKDLKICIKWEVNINYDNPKHSVFRCKAHKTFTKNDSIFENLKKHVRQSLVGECLAKPKLGVFGFSCSPDYISPEGDIVTDSFGSISNIDYVLFGIYKDTNTCKRGINTEIFTKTCSDATDFTGYVCWDHIEKKTLCEDNFDLNNFYFAIGVHCKHKSYFNIPKNKMYCVRLNSNKSYYECIYKRYTCYVSGTYRRDLIGYSYAISYRDIKGLRFRDEKVLSLYDPNIVYE